MPDDGKIKFMDLFSAVTGENACVAEMAGYIVFQSFRSDILPIDYLISDSACNIRDNSQT